MRLSPSNDNINNLKNYRDFTEENKQFDSNNNQDDDTQHNDVTSWSELDKKKIHQSFDQGDLTEILVINKNIKRLNRRTIYRTFIAIN